MTIKRDGNAKGFTLVEVLVATLVTMIVIGGVVGVFKSASDASQRGLVRADTQQKARGSLSIINRDLGQASIGIPPSGIPLPSGPGNTGLAKFACSPLQCFLAAGNNNYPNNTLSPVNPGDNKGPVTPTAPGGTDVITIAYLDPTWPVTNKNLTAMAANGTSITVNIGTFDTSGNPAPAPTGLAYNDALFGAKVGDVLLIQNQAGAAVATITKVDAAGQIELQAGDPLNLNQPGATFGNVQAIYNAALVTQTSAARINVVTYFIQIQAGPDGVVGTADDIPVLMRQVNTQNAIPVAEYAQDLQFTYDVFNAAALPPYQAGLLGSAVANASQIRKISVSLTLRSQFTEPLGNFHTLTVSSAVSPRDLSFTDRYK